jgi:hypothetical protein
MFLMLLLTERTSFRNCFFSGLVREDLSMALISSNRADKLLTCAALNASGVLPVAEVISEAALADREAVVNRAIIREAVTFFMTLVVGLCLYFHQQRSSLWLG